MGRGFNNQSQFLVLINSLNSIQWNKQIQTLACNVGKSLGTCVLCVVRDRLLRAE